MRRRVLAGVCLAALAWAWWVSGLRPFRWSTTVAVELPALLVGWLLARRTRVPRTTTRRSGAGWPWLVLLAAAATRELVALLAGDRRRYPSLSRLVDALLTTHVERYVLVLAWLGVGARLVANRARAVRRG
ncbi:MAG: hypothetical protein ACYDAQ_00955 [Mycobacteriales bacterium]